MDRETKRAIIMEHYQKPLHRYPQEENSYYKVNTANSSCIDNLNIYVKFDDDKIADISFEGEACAISIASTSIMIHNLIGLTKEEALNYIEEFQKMVAGQNYDEDLIGEANVFDDIYKQGNRQTCATLPYRGLKQAIENNL